MVGIRDDLITRLERRIDRKIRYTSISPSLFGSFDVRNVSIMGKDDRPVLTMSRFRVAYSLWDLLRGRLQGIHSVRIDSPFIDFNTARDHDLISLLESLYAGDNRSGLNADAIFPEQLLVRIRNGRCLVIDGRNRFDLDALNCNAEIDGDRVVVDGRWNVGFTVNALVGESLNAQALMRLSGSFRTDMKEGEAVLSIPEISGDATSVSPVAFGLALEDSLIRLGKMPDQLPIDVWVEYGIDDKKIDAHLDCTSFRLGEWLSFSGGLSPARQFLDIAGSGTAFFERRHDGTLGYAVDLSGRALDSGSFVINAAGDEQTIRVDTLHLSMPVTGQPDAFFFGNANFSGNIALDPPAPEGILVFRNFSLSGAENVNAHIGITTHDDGIMMTSETLKMGKVTLAYFNVLLQPRENDLDFTVSARRSAGRGSFSLEGSMDSALRRAQAKLRLDSFSAGDISGMTLPFVKKAVVPPLLAGVLDTAAISTEIFLVTDFTVISYNAPSFAFSSRAGKGFSGVVSLIGTERNFELYDGHFSRGEDSISLALAAEFSGPRDISFSMQSDYRNIAYLIDGTVRGESIAIQGSHGLNVKLSANNRRGYTGSVSAGTETGGFPVPFLGHPAFLFCSAHIRYDTAASWSVYLEQFDLENITGPAGLTQVRVSGSADQSGITIPLLYYQDNLGPLNGKADVSWTADYSGFTGTAQLGAGNETYHVIGSLLSGHGALICSGSSVRLERLFGNRVNVLANGDIRVSWNPSDRFRTEFSFPLIYGTLYGQEFGASVHAVLNDEEFIINNMRVNVAEMEWTVFHSLISSARGAAETQVMIGGYAGGRPIAGSLSLEAGFAPLRSWFEMGEIIHSVAGTLHVESLRYGIKGEEQIFDVAFSRNDGTLSVLGGPRDMLRLQMDPDGNFYAGLSRPFPVRGTIIGSVNQNTINARCGDLYVDMGELFNLLPENDKIYLTGGYVSAAVDIRGSLSDPEFFGSARGTSLRVRVPGYVPQEVRPIPFTIVFDGNEARFGPVAVAAGNGGGMVSGWFRFDRWIPNIFSLDIAVPRDTPVPYNFDISGLTAHGDVFGNLNVSMEDLSFDVSGNLYANNTELGINSDEMNASRGRDAFSRSPYPVTVNLTVITGPVVEFIYPNSRFPILRANPDIGSKVHITADSLAGQYSIISDVKIRGGEIFYFERSFYIRSGTLTFRENELNFDPRLTARAEVRDRTGDGPVTISMVVDNAPLLSFVARFESSPPLSQMEILTMLGQNMAGSQFGDNTDAAQRALFSSVSDFAAQFLLVQQLERQIRTFMRLDMFSVRTQVFQNMLFMASGMTSQPVDRTAGVGNYFDNTTVSAGKYIGQDMFVSGMLSMRYDADQASMVTVAPDIGVELQNPLFSIRWDFNPTHPENWYVNDNSITLTKTFTF
jgi:hypothetical protein